jgi:hypothetical protein
MLFAKHSMSVTVFLTISYPSGMFSYLTEKSLRWKSFQPLLPDRFWNPPSLLYNWYWGLFHRGWSGRIVKLTTHLHIYQSFYLYLFIDPHMAVVCMFKFWRALAIFTLESWNLFMVTGNWNRCAKFVMVPAMNDEQCLDRVNLCFLFDQLG